jgi:probable F420-dependent oxidoreductase
MNNVAKKRKTQHKRRRSMKFGVVFPQTEIGAEVGAIRAYAQAAEDLAYDYLLAYEHVVGANPNRPGGWAGRPYDHNSLFHEPFVLFGYLAAITERLELATGILILPQRQTVLIAKQAAQVDLLSGGRLRLGIGVGWNEVEYEALGQDFRTRGRRQAEQVDLLRRLWTERLVNFTGEFDFVPDAGIYPLPVQQPIPIWFGGGADPVLRRMAVQGDGWMPNTMTLDQLTKMLEILRSYLTESGRDPNDFGIDFRISLNRTPEAEWKEMIDRLQALNVSHICFNTMGMGFVTVDQHIDAMQRFKAVADELGE